jgi:hypothetical protein
MQVLALIEANGAEDWNEFQNSFTALVSPSVSVAASMRLTHDENDFESIGQLPTETVMAFSIRFKDLAKRAVENIDSFRVIKKFAYICTPSARPSWRELRINSLIQITNKLY